MMALYATWLLGIEIPFMLFVVIVAIFAILAMVLLVVHVIKTIFCKHEKYFENRACSAICCKCGKDLGFIQLLREQRKKDEIL